MNSIGLYISRSFFYLLAILTLLFPQCVREKVIILSDEKEILEFKIEGLSHYVRQEGQLLNILLYEPLDISTPYTTLIIVSDNATINPPSGEPQFFSYTSNIKYAVTAQSGNAKDYFVKIHEKLITDKTILDFTIPNKSARVNFHDFEINIEVYHDIDITSLTPIISIPSGSTISPESGEMVDFTNPVIYTVTGLDGSTISYTVKVTKTLSRNNYIENFELIGTEQILERDAENLFIYVPYETDVSNVKTIISVSPNAIVSPESGTPVNFTNPQIYTVTSSDGTVKEYTVTIKKSPWRKVTTLPFSRDEIGCIVFKGKLWILAGWIPGETLHSGEVWNSSDGENWQKVLENAPWQSANTIRFIVFKDNIYAINGGISKKEIWRSSDGIIWNKVMDAPWGERHNPYMAVFKDKIWLMGGHNLSNKFIETLVYNDIWSSSDGINWVLERDYAKWPPRGLIYGECVLNGYIYFYGGGVYTDNVWEAHKDVWRSSNGVDWTQIVYEAPWERRVFHTIATHGGKIWLLGGGSLNMNSYLSNEVWYSADGYSWTEIKHNFFPDRHAGGFISFNEKLWIIAGLGCNDIWVLEE